MLDYNISIDIGAIFLRIRNSFSKPHSPKLPILCLMKRRIIRPLLFANNYSFINCSLFVIRRINRKPNSKIIKNGQKMTKKVWKNESLA